MTLQHPAERVGQNRTGRFEKLAELASNFTSSAFFSVLCMGLVGAFAAVHAAHLPIEWQHLVGDSMGAVSLLLLALLKNSERRAEHAIQRKLDAIAAALLEQQQGRRGDAEEELESAIGMEERY
ncbi:hypothetical protein ACFV2Q_37770 [Streptomyces sp. NPDC059650]|uniref:hypothetical protein n=1 Tax=Streptomyces sp. NPDC059650 TaxID=3346896 RepID=UPI0036C35EC2